MGKGFQKGKGQGKSKGTSKGSNGQGTRQYALNPALQQLNSRLDEAHAIIQQNAFFRSFRSTFQREASGKSLLQVLQSHMDKVSMAFHTFTPGFTPSGPQIQCAVAVCKLMQRMGIEGIPEAVVAEAAPVELPEDSNASEDVNLDPGLTQRLEEGKRILYIMRIGDSFYFKLGTYKLLKKDFNPQGPCILDRFSNRPTPPSGIPPDTVWEMERLVLQEFAYTDLGEEPDKEIHSKLRALAQQLNLPLAPQGEFHHLAMLSKAVELLRAAGNPPHDMAVQTDAPSTSPATSSSTSTTSPPTSSSTRVVQNITVQTGRFHNIGIRNTSLRSFMRRP